LRPKARDLLVTDPFLTGHIGASHAPLFARIFPVRLAAQASHDPVGIKGQIANRVDSFFFCLEVFAYRRTVRAGKGRVPHEIQVRLRATSDDRHTGRDAVTAFRLDVPQDCLALETVQALAQEQGYPTLLKITGDPSTRF